DPAKSADARSNHPASSGAAPAVASVAAGRRVLFVVPNRGLHYPDYENIWNELKVKGIESRIASTSLEPCKPFNCELPPNFRADLALNNDTPVDDYAAVVVVGGDVWEYLPNDSGAEPVKRLIQRALDAKKIVASICTGQAVLAANGFFTGGKLKVAKSDYL